ncbi:MAG: S41 family peptidase [bacterium]
MVSLARFIALLSVCTLAAQTALAQGPAACDCPAAFSRTVQAIQTDYVAFPLEVPLARRAEWDAHVARLRPLAADVDRAACSWVLRSLTAFFHDGHLLIVDQPADTSGRTTRRAAVPRRSWSEAGVRHALGRRDLGHNSPEGIWDGPGFRVAVLADSTGDGRLTAVVVRDDSSYYDPGHVRGTFEQVGGQWRATVLDGSYLPRTSPVEFSREGLMRMAPAMWQRVWPVVPSAGLDASDPRRPTIRYLPSGTAVVSVVSFSPEYRTLLQRLVDDEWARLAKAPSVIIDLRGNEGGASFVAEPLLPLLWSGTQTPPDSTTPVVIASVTNRAFWARTSWAPRGLGDRLAVAPNGSLVPFSNESTPRPERPARLAPPQQRVVILTDHSTVSAAEQVVLWAREYGRARIYGEATGGAIDYQSTLLVRVACSAMGQLLSYPLIATSSSLPAGGFNRRGIMPDVLIPADTRDVFAWIDAH